MASTCSQNKALNPRRVSAPSTTTIALALLFLAFSLTSCLAAAAGVGSASFSSVVDPPSSSSSSSSSSPLNSQSFFSSSSSPHLTSLLTPLFASTPFRSWLRNLTISLPPVSIVEGNLNVSVVDFMCKDLDFQIINSSFDPTYPYLSFSLAITGVQISCKGAWETREIPWPHLREGGGVEAGIGNTSLVALMTVEEDLLRLPVQVHVHQFAMRVQLSPLSFSGDFSKILNKLQEMVVQLLDKELPDFIQSAFTKAMEVDLTQALVQIDNKIRPFLLPVPPSPSPPIPEGSMNLQDNGFLHFFDRLLDTNVGAAGLNRLVKTLTRDTGVLRLRNLTHAQFTLINTSAVGTVVMGITEVAVGGLDTWTDFDILHPKESSSGSNSNYSVDTTTALDALVINITFYVNVSVAGHVQGGTLVESAQLSLYLAHSAMHASMVLALKEAVMSSLDGGQWLHLGCVSPAVSIINITQILINTTVKDFRLVAIGSSGSDEDNLDKALVNLLSFFTHSLGATIPAFFNGLIGGPMRMQVNDALVNFFVAHLSDTCPQSGVGQDVDSLTLVAPWSCCVAIFLIIGFIILRVGKKGDEKKRSDDPSSASRTLNGDPYPAFVPHEKTPLMDGSGAPSSSSAYPSYVPSSSSHLPPSSSASLLHPSLTSSSHAAPSQSPCLMLHPGIHPWYRYGMLFFLIFNIALFVIANCNVGATVYMVLTMGGHTTTLPALFEFTLANSVHDMWQAGVYPLSLLIAMFSGCWPYVKLLLMIFCLLVPPRVLSISRRETVLRFLDALGKWSLIDTYVMVMMLVAFRFHVPAPHDPTTSFDVFVQADIAILFFSAATMLSLVLSHVCLALHRSVTTEHKVLALPLADSEALRSHRFRISNHLTRLTKIGQLVLPLIVLFALGALCAGAIIPSFRFVFQGAAALVLEAVGVTTSTDYSLFNLGQLMPESSQFPDHANIRFLQIAYYTFVIVMPLANLISLFFLWLAPLTLRAQHRLFVMVEVFNAWSALDVFVVAIITSLLELQQFAQFIVGGRCDVINVLLKEYFDVILDGDDVCFDVVSTLAKGCWVLFGASVVIIIASVVVMQTCHSALLERTRTISKFHNINMDDEEGDDEEEEGVGGGGEREEGIYGQPSVVDSRRKGGRGKKSKKSKSCCSLGSCCDCGGKASLFCVYLGLVVDEFEV